MLRSLHIRNYILIESVDIEFPDGLVIITGQTGAGKSILLGALSLLSGARADASMIGSGADSCVVEAEFECSDAVLKELLSEADIPDEGNTLLVRRVISSSGRSRGFVNDCPVQQGLLQRISRHLVDIHSQHKSLLLIDKAFQLSVLDAYAGNGESLERCKRAWKELCSARSALADAKERAALLEREHSYNEEQFRRLDAAALKSGELESLEEEQTALANAEQIKEALGAAISLVDTDEGHAPGVSSALKEAVRQLSGISRYLGGLEELQTRLDSARIEVEDICEELRDMDEKISVSPSRLEAVEERMSLLYGLMRRYECSDVDALIALREDYAAKLAGSETAGEQIARLQAEEKAAEEAWRKEAALLSETRKAAAPAMAGEISESLAFLELENAGFEISVVPGQGGPDGSDEVRFLFSSVGSEPMELAKVASGGEISRIMLSLKTMMARLTSMPTMIFDEIDTGVSGSVADKIGRKICDMGSRMQVFSITHLPQVAAKGEAHYVVSKEKTADGRTVSTVRRVEGEERVLEIARLLSGETVTEAAVANARALLD